MSKKKGGMKLIFCMPIDIKLSYKLIPLILVVITRLAQITQNNKFAKFLHYLKIGVRVEVDVLCRRATQLSKDRFDECGQAYL